jgi:membrane protease YdiL (CAAX protease family)
MQLFVSSSPKAKMVSDGIVTGVVNLVVFGLVVAFRRLFHREGLRAFLLHGDARGRRLFLKGAVVGLLSFAVFPIVVILCGQGHLAFIEGGLLTTVTYTIAWGMGFLAVALTEEAFFRGYLLQKLLVRSPQWVAVVLSSLLFGALHVGSYGSGITAWLGILNAGIFGVVLSLVVIRGRSLMWAVGFHWAWNLAQAILLIEPSEGFNALMNLQVREGLWTGAPFYPDTGIVETVTFVLLGVAIVLWYGQPYNTNGQEI